MNEGFVDHTALRKKAQDAKTFAIVSLCLKASVIMMGIVSKIALVMLVMLAYIPVAGWLSLILMIPLILFIAFSWFVYFAYIAFAIVALVYAIPLLEASKKVQDVAVSQEISGNATFALVSSIIIIALLFVQ